MIKRKLEQQTKIELVGIEELVPREFLLRKIYKAISFSCIHDKVKNLYCPDNGGRQQMQQHN